MGNRNTNKVSRRRARKRAEQIAAKRDASEHQQVDVDPDDERSGLNRMLARANKPTGFVEFERS